MIAAPSPAEPAVRIAELRFRYGEGDFELRIPELTVQRGERLAVVGPSGSGKTTLLHLIAGIARPERGCVRTGGAELCALDEAARRDFRVRHVGLVFQEFELLEYLSVLDNVLLPYRINPALRLDAAVRERAAELAQRVGIADKLSRLSRRLSQGEKQRVAVCRALIAEPELLLADEPTGNLDPANKDRVLDILVDYAEERGATLLTVTHDRDLLTRFARVIDFKTFQSPRAVPIARALPAEGSVAP
jgi:ABC-type lipoprotein export system ATPase subunit